MKHPRIIQGGMGIGASGWQLARAVSLEGQLGVVSGTALSHVLARRLQDGDPGGHMRRALAAFPDREIVNQILGRYFVQDGIPDGTPYRNVPLPGLKLPKELEGLNAAANFAEVFLAKENHAGIVGINYLEKIQIPFLSSLYGALLAGVDYVLVGAGIPRHIPAAIAALCAHEDFSLKTFVEGASKDDPCEVHFSPRKLINRDLAPLKRPRFLAIVSSATLARSLARSTTPPDGFVVEAASAGGHNAPPRGPLQLNERGEPVYGERDAIDLEAIAGLGLPFWLAGSRASPKHLTEALAKGAAGIQVGTAFAFCAESGFTPEIKAAAIKLVHNDKAAVRTDAKASPTGFPFKLLEMDGTLGKPEVYKSRIRSSCDVGLLRTAYKREDGSLGFKCPAEAEEDFFRKGGTPEDAEGRLCLCNGLLASIGLAQKREAGVREIPIVTSGDDLGCVRALTPKDGDSYSARDVIRYLLAG